MRNLINKLGIGLLAVVLVAGSGCNILEDKVLQIVLSEDACAEFLASETTDNWTKTAVIDYGQEISDILAENDYARTDLEAITLTSAFYGVTQYNGGTNWVISGVIRVRRTDADATPAEQNYVTITNYSQVSIPAALDKKLQADLNQAGVGLLNQALADFLIGDNPILEFQIESLSADISPDPSVANPMMFTWKAWLVFQILLNQEIENVPDVF
jgi:hypothetical protein